MIKCPRCGYQFKRGLKDKGKTYTEVKGIVEGLLQGGQTIDVFKIGKQYGKPKNEIVTMLSQIRQKRPDKILRPAIGEQGKFSFMEKLEKVTSATDRRWRHILGQIKIFTQDKSEQVQLLEKAGNHEHKQLADGIRETYHIIGDLLPEPVKAKRLKSGNFKIITNQPTNSGQNTTKKN